MPCRPTRTISRPRPGGQDQQRPGPYGPAWPDYRREPSAVAGPVVRTEPGPRRPGSVAGDASMVTVAMPVTSFPPWLAPPRLPSHLGAVGWVFDADAFGGGVFVASEYLVTMKAALLRLGLGGAPGDPEWDDLLLCSNTKSWKPSCRSNGLATSQAPAMPGYDRPCGGTTLRLSPFDGPCDVDPGAECSARSRQHDCSRLVARCRPAQPGGQLIEHLMGQCVEPFGPGQPKDGGGGIGPLHQHRCFLVRVQHRSGSSLEGRRAPSRRVRR